MQIKTIKRWLSPLRDTPLHPQWLIRKPITKTDLGRFTGLAVDIGCAGRNVQELLPESAEYIGIDYYETAIN